VTSPTPRCCATSACAGAQPDRVELAAARARKDRCRPGADRGGHRPRPRSPRRSAADLRCAPRACPNGYELLKDFTRGTQVDATGLAAFIDKLPLPAAERARLKGLARSSTSVSRRKWRVPSSESPRRECCSCGMQLLHRYVLIPLRVCDTVKCDPAHVLRRARGEYPMKA
jgi:hypothetical protein